MRRRHPHSSVMRSCQTSGRGLIFEDLSADQHRLLLWTKKVFAREKRVR